MSRVEQVESFETSVSHFHRSAFPQELGNESFRKVVLNAILWMANADVPANGVECSVTENDLMQNLDEKGQRKPTAQTPSKVEPFPSPVTGK